MPSRRLNVGIIGCGEVTQVIHIPVLNQLFLHFDITYLCSTSPAALDFCATRVIGGMPKCTSEPKELCTSPEVDVVFVLSADELHQRHTLLALANQKHVFVEKPLAMSLADAQSIIEAEKASLGSVFVGYMRRHAAGFHGIREEVKQLDKIVFARVRDIIGPNSIFVEQSATFPKRFSDYPAKETQDRAALLEAALHQALEVECKVEKTPDRVSQYQNLCSLGSHDLSAMREVLGMPEAVAGASIRNDFWNVLFKYPGYTVSYESGFHDIPMFDAHIEVYGVEKSVRVQWDNPFIRGLPVTTTIKQRDGGGLKETHRRTTYEDPFVAELKALHAMATENGPVKTSAEDATMDLHICQMIMRSAA